MRRAASGGGRCVRFRPFAIRDRRKSSGVDRGYADPVVVDEDISENNTLDLIPRQLICRDSVDFFFLQGGKKTFHAGIVKAMPGAAETL